MDAPRKDVFHLFQPGSNHPEEDEQNQGGDGGESRNAYADYAGWPIFAFSGMQAGSIKKSFSGL